MIVPEYKVRYMILESNDIFNKCGPEHVGPWKWDEDSIKSRTERAELTMKRLNERTGFYTTLEKSILKEGVRNPILVTAGWCQPDKLEYLSPKIKSEYPKILICDLLGGSRLWVAQKHNLKIPCVVSDFNNMFPEIQETKTSEDLRKYYSDQPVRIKFTKYGVYVNQS